MNMNRSEIQQELINNMIDGMDHTTMWQVLFDFMDQSYDKYTDEELMEEGNEYYPHILEEEELTTKEIDDKLGYETYSKWAIKNNIKSSQLIIIASGVFALLPLLLGNCILALVIDTWPNQLIVWLTLSMKSLTSPINISNSNNTHWVLSWSDTGDKIATYDNQFKAYQIRRYLECLINKSASRFHPSPTD